MSAIKNGIVATGAEDNTVKTWDVQKGTCTKTLTGHSHVSIIIIVCVFFYVGSTFILDQLIYI